jgi:hypothetical protein
VQFDWSIITMTSKCLTAAVQGQSLNGLDSMQVSLQITRTKRGFVRASLLVYSEGPERWINCEDNLYRIYNAVASFLTIYGRNASDYQVCNLGPVHDLHTAKVLSDSYAKRRRQ